MPTYIHTFTGVANGSPKVSSTKMGAFERSNGKRPVITTFTTGSLVRIESGSIIVDIDLTSERVIVDNIANGGTSTTYNAGDITASALHDVLNAFYQVNVLTA